jgi:hypothetical protein
LVFSDFAHYRVASRGLRSVLICYSLNEIRARLSAVAKKRECASLLLALEMMDKARILLFQKKLG